jgi:hypothetical protein
LEAAGPVTASSVDIDQGTDSPPDGPINQKLLALEEQCNSRQAMKGVLKRVTVEMSIIINRPIEEVFTADSLFHYQTPVIMQVKEE